MEATLFKEEEIPKFFLDFHYDGESFDGQIELGKLARELDGLNDAVQIALQSLVRHKRISVSLGDVEIYVLPFEDGSFRKYLGVTVKHIKKNKEVYSVATNLGILLVTTLQLVKSSPIDDLLAMSNQLKIQIRDEVKIELMQDPQFLKGIAALAYPIAENNDRLILRGPNNEEVVIGQGEKTKLEALSGTSTDVQLEKTTHETLRGRITRVDLDATINHLGFKAKDEGTTIKCTLLHEMDSETKRNLLGRWVEITGTTTFQGEYRTKIDIDHIKTIELPSQQVISFDE